MWMSIFNLFVITWIYLLDLIKMCEELSKYMVNIQRRAKSRNDPGWKIKITEINDK